jgi:CBS domain-containing protein
MKTLEMMTKNVHCVGPDASLATAWHVMRSFHIRHLPVTWDTRLVGMITDRDLLVRGHLQTDGTVNFKDEPVASAMTDNPLAVDSATPVSRIAELMVEASVDSVPIVDRHRQVVGLVTAGDLLNLLATHPRASDVLALNFSVREVLSVSPRA